MGTQPSAIVLQTSVASSSLARRSRASNPDTTFPSDGSSLPQCFDEVFTEASAVHPTEVEDAFRLRYQVYCLDRGFEEAAACPNGLEQDEFDIYAYHSLLRDRASQQVLGTVRLVHPGDSSPNWITKLPLADYAAVDCIEELFRLPAGSTAEVSRFAISRSARQYLSQTPADAAGSPNGGLSWGAKLLPYMSLGLIRGLVRISQERGITHWCLAAEPSLLRRLRSFGLHFQEAGPMVEHRGLRQICYAALNDLLLRAEAERPECWKIMTQNGSLLSASAARNAA